MNLEIKEASEVNELHQIIQLQSIYHRGRLNETEKSKLGFLTIKHSIQELLLLQTLAPQIIALNEGKVVAFALAMHPQHSSAIPDLKQMFDHFSSLTYNQQPIQNYYAMGQICIHQDWHGKGVFRLLYEKHKELFSAQFKYCITEISQHNHRSMNAHTKIGFKKISSYTDTLDTWNIVLWDWQ